MILAELSGNVTARFLVEVKKRSVGASRYGNHNVLLFIPAVVSYMLFERDKAGVSIGNFGWPLANTVVFGVLLSENYSEDKLVSSKDFHREFFVTFVCTIVLELFYFPELSLWGLLLCGLLLYFGVRKLDPFYSNYLELGLESPEPLSTSIMKPIRHILSERKSRKIALFLLINTGYMVVEFVAGFMSNSLGLISDACHMLFDCAALAIGLYASYISRLPANSQFNYGRGRVEVLSGYVNAVFLVLVGALIVLESFERILDPQEISTNSLLTVSIGGLVVNVVVIPLLRNSAEILLQRVPRAHEQDLRVAVNDIMKIKGVRGIQNLRVWSFTNTDIVGTLHLHVSSETDKASMKAQVSHILHDAGIKDLTMQVECIK
ncbi:hypothetical protein GH714_011679 [Hevea brasiliensis]|uniref:Cation efflux protein transmembrane domain-containing protein n=1 Tax=Hevea brasiliensis TaxID=3981 RepID=A0A6A6M4M8_HEVBR|nr:hypothetical protein GH714_011679 [Hevea brasiliensis]